MTTIFRRPMLVLGTAILIMQAVFVPVGMVYADTTMDTEEQELVELPPMKNYLEEEQNDNPRFSFTNSHIKGTVEEQLNISFYANQPVSEVKLTLPFEASIVEDQLAGDTFIERVEETQEWIITTSSAKSMFILPVLFLSSGIYEIKLNDTSMNIEIIEKESQKNDSSINDTISEQEEITKTESQILSFSKNDIQYVSENGELTIDFNASISINTFRLSLPKGVELLENKRFHSIQLVDTDKSGTNSYIITSVEYKREFSIDLVFYEGGKKQITVEDKLGEQSADFLFVIVGNNISREYERENLIRSSVSVATAAQFVTAWNNTRTSQIIAAPTAQRTLSVSQVNNLSQLSRTLTITRNSSFYFQPVANSRSRTLTMSSRGKLILNGNSSIPDALTAPSISIQGFNISGGSLEIMRGVYFNGSLTQRSGLSISVDSISLSLGGRIQLLDDYNVTTPMLNLTSAGLNSHNRSGEFLFDASPNSGSLNISGLTVSTPYLFAKGKNSSTRSKAWENIEAVVVNNNVVSSNHLGFTNESFSISDYTLFTDVRTVAGSIVPEPPKPTEPPKPVHYSITLVANPEIAGNPLSSAQESLEGETVQIEANPNEGYKFLRWEIIFGSKASLGDETSEITILTLGNTNVTVQAVYEEIPEEIQPILPKDPLDPEVEVDPENQPALPEDQGLLSIDFISSFNFGSQAISVHDQTYYAQPQRLLNEDGTVNEYEERPNYVQISDRRSESERNGWELAVTQKEQFKSKENQILNGASLSLSNQQVITAQDGTAPGLQYVPCELIPGNRRTLLKAQGNEGIGTWIYRFGDGETAGESVALEVPRGANPEATTYSTTLIWELSTVPGN